MTLPAQSCVISSTNFWPKPVEPRGFGAATTQPCAAHSDGFHRYDHASLPRALRAAVDQKDDGILLRRVEARRLDQPVLNRRAARARHGQALRLLELRRPSAMPRSRASAAAARPSRRRRGRSRPARSAMIFEKIAKFGAESDALTSRRPCADRCGVAAARPGTRYRLSVAVARRGEHDRRCRPRASVKSLTDRSGVSNTVRFVPVARS